MQAQLFWEHHPVWQILLTWGNLNANYQKNTFSLWKPDEILHKEDNIISTKDYLGSKHVANVFLIRMIPMLLRDFRVEEWDTTPLVLITLSVLIECQLPMLNI